MQASTAEPSARSTSATLCADGYFASLADPSVCYPDPCVGDPCNGRGSCESVADRTGVDAAQCDCGLAFVGEQCEQCAQGYEGDDCERCATGYVRDGVACVEPACLEIPCGAHGSCTDRDGDGVGTCLCDTGWSGRDCGGCAQAYSLVDGQCVPDACAGIDCGPGQCRAAGNEPTCVCPQGYMGELCGQCAAGFTATNGGADCENVLPITGRRLTASYDAAAPWTLTLDADAVDTWRQSHGDGELWQINGDSQRPRYILLPPAVEFTGGQSLWTYAHTLRTGDQYTIFLVATWNPAGGRQGILDSVYPDGGSEAYALEALDENTVLFRHNVQDDESGDVVTSTDFDANKGRQLIVVQRGSLFNATLLSLSNGTDTTAVEATAGPLTTAPIGVVGRCVDTLSEFACDAPLDGRTHELLFYEGTLSAQERAQIVAYLRHKWSL